VLLFVGFTGHAFDRDIQVDVAIGEQFSIGSYVFRVDDIQASREVNYDMSRAVLAVYEDGRQIANMYPEIRFYHAGEGQQTREPSIRSTLSEDLYVRFAAVAPGGRQATLQARINPLVMWVWIGGIVVALGTLVAMLPNRRVAVARRDPEAPEDEAARAGEETRVHA
jgi:cytochrome c-type biogenesis protein CcmF